MRKALILTVGTGGDGVDIVPPLVKSIQRTRLDRVCLLETGASSVNAGRIQAECGPETVVSVAKIEDPDDVEYVFRRALSELRRLRDEGFAPEEIGANYTSGTKPMSAGLALAGVAFGCDALDFVSGQRPEGGGVVIAGSERFREIPPVGILAQAEVRLGVELLRRLQFEAVRRLFPNGVPILDVYDQRLVTGLQRLADAYDAWDKFQHGGFIKRYHEADLSMSDLTPFRLSPRIAERVQAMHRHEDDRRPPLTEDHLADLWSNASRRILEGRHDDAVARLYRLTEMIAQFELQRKYGVMTASVEPEKLAIATGDREQLEGQRRNGKVQLGLQQDYDLLKKLDSPLGEAFMQHTKLSNLLAKRNSSILAHGQSPETADDAEALAEEVAALTEIVVPDFRARCAELQFPWLAQAGT